MFQLRAKGQTGVSQGKMEGREGNALSWEKALKYERIVLKKMKQIQY